MRAYLYTWGEGRMTAEGESIPVRVESLDVGYIDGMMCFSSSCFRPLAEGLPPSVRELQSASWGTVLMSLKEPEEGDLLQTCYRTLLVC